MDEDYAYLLLHTAMKDYRRRSYSTLLESLGRTDLREVKVPNGTPFKTEFRVVWASGPGGAVRVIGSIDDSRQGSKAVSLEFIKNHDDTFVEQDL